jgi:hypothetical protein
MEKQHPQPYLILKALISVREEKARKLKRLMFKII